jgi:hypothetical protein
VTPTFIVMLAVFSLLVSSLGDLARSRRHVARLETAAEAMALAAASGGQVATLATRYGVNNFEINVDGAMVTVLVWSDDGRATATAHDHRRTLGRVE